MTTSPTASRVLTVPIARSPQQVYDYVHDGRNLPAWSVFATVTQADDAWVMATPEGEVRLRFVPENPERVLDHTVTLPTGAEHHVMLRVEAADTGSALVYTLVRKPDMSDAAFDSSASEVVTDLTKLKVALEASVPAA